MSTAISTAIIRIKIEAKKHSPSCTFTQIDDNNLDIRHFGEWEDRPEDAGEEDNDFQVLSDHSCADFERLVRRIESDLGVCIEWGAGEKNYISVTVTTKKTATKKTADSWTVWSVAPNPKKAGSAAHARYELWKVGMSKEQALAAGLTKADLANDIKKEFVCVVDETGARVSL